MYYLKVQCNCHDKNCPARSKISSRYIINKLWEANARYRIATKTNKNIKMSSYNNRGGGGYNNTYAGRSAASRAAAPAAKKRMLKLVILGDSG